MSTATIVEPGTENEAIVIISDEESHDDSRVAHIVKREAANEGYIGQQMIEALCGYRWIPSKNPDDFPVCHKCVDVLKRRGNRNSN